MHSFVDHNLLDSSDALVTNTQNFSRNATERRREISRRGHEFFVLSKRKPDMLYGEAPLSVWCRERYCQWSYKLRPCLRMN